MNRRFRTAGFLVLLGAGALNAGQEPQQEIPQTPTFKAEVEYVEVDVLVTDGQGRFVDSLQKEDFQVLEDGKPQTISTFSLVEIPIERAVRPLYADQPIEPDVKSNERPFDGRTYIMLLVDLHTSFASSALVRRAARNFIEEKLAANDLMAVIHTAGRAENSQEFTSNKRLLLAAVDKFLGRKLESATLERNDVYVRQGGLDGGRIDDPLDSERGMNARSTLTSIKNIAQWFAGVRGRRKTILFVSEGIDYDITDVFNNRSASSILDDTREAVGAATRSNVSVYAIDPRGLASALGDTIGVAGFGDQGRGASSTSGTDSQGSSSTQKPPEGLGFSSLMNEQRLAQDSLRTLAEETGGLALVNTNSLANGFDRIVNDNSAYYLLAYYPPAPKRDGRFHRIEVRVTRPGVTVRSRRGYAAPRGKPAAPPATGGVSPELAAALNSPLPMSGLRMRVFATPFKGTAPNASLLLGIEMNGRDLPLASNGRIDLSYLAIDAKGKTFGGKTDRIVLNLKPDTRARVEQSAVRVLNRMDLPPGVYQLRVAVHDTAGGAVGSVIYDVEIPDFHKPPFGISGLAITSMSASAAMTVRADELLKGVMPAAPVAARTFPEGDELALFAEVYDNAADVPHGVDIVATVTSDVGTVVFKTEEERRSTELQGRTGGYGFTARVPLTDFQPGLYVLTVEARSRLGGTPAVKRQVQFQVTPSPREEIR